MEMTYKVSFLLFGLSAVCAQNFAPLTVFNNNGPSPPKPNEAAQAKFRDSISRAIRDNIAKQQLGKLDKDDYSDSQTVASPSAVVQPALQQYKSTTPYPRNIAKLPTRFSPVLNEEIDTFEAKEAKRELEEEQAKSAQYSYDSSIDDTINDQSVTRQETRDGLSLKGLYSYSDGFFKRTVHYEADEGGYRVVKEEIQPIGDGPVINPLGKADVSTSLAGSYSITSDDVRQPKRTPVRGVNEKE